MALSPSLSSSESSANNDQSDSKISARALKAQDVVDQDPLKMRDPTIRLNDFYEVYEKPDPQAVQQESKRCMGCGAAFCMPEGGYLSNDNKAAGCPISNRIPEWNRLVETGRWRDAYERLALTNNFPEFTSRVCPAPCQDSCIVGINERPVGIKSIERAIIDRAFDSGWVKPNLPQSRTGKHVAIIGSGPAGLAAADQLNAQGHHVTVYERADQPGGLLTYGIPAMKLEKHHVQRRIALLEAAGIVFKTNCNIGYDIDALKIKHESDAMILATGALQGRDLDLPGRSAHGIIQALPYLEAAAKHQNRTQQLPHWFNAKDKNVVIIGGGDTGADCIATALRQKAKNVQNITRRQKPSNNRDNNHPWPGNLGNYQLDYAHTEGKSVTGLDPRCFGIQPLKFEVDSPTGQVKSIHVRIESKLNGTETKSIIDADMVILAVGFTGTDSPGIYENLGFSSKTKEYDLPKNIVVAGDARIGPSLIVNAIAEGRQASKQILKFLAI